VALARKGRRRLLVGDRVYYWDYRMVGAKPGQVDDRVWFGVNTVLRVVSEDKRWRLTLEGTLATIEPGRRRFRLEATILGKGPGITPGIVRAVIERCLELPAAPRK
jgi:hypothetical protein